MFFLKKEKKIILNCCSKTYLSYENYDIIEKSLKPKSNIDLKNTK